MAGQKIRIKIKIKIFKSDFAWFYVIVAAHWQYTPVPIGAGCAMDDKGYDSPFPRVLPELLAN
ncbi:hypothetical protein KTQ42_11635|uniref:hypothetical protein n=1 Tax=Noviherbaspirillum sp. L7-7A TaxID=2850560 RepID=UPI001C2BAA72|nr:hypothetical protein [Noviherbaspirillum sp. L7-7A]MBV0879954.1 hypothetical protein [Noviherbaspirillum sp. L7-7A]